MCFKNAFLKDVFEEIDLEGSLNQEREERVVQVPTVAAVPG